MFSSLIKYTIMKKPYLPKDEAGRVIWLQNFKNKLADYAATLGITPAELAQVEADSETFSGFVGFLEAMREYSKTATDFKNNLFKSTQTIGALPPAPTITLPAAARFNIFGETAKLVQTIKNHPNYNTTIGENLGIIGEEDTFDPAALKPQLKLAFRVNHPVIKWVKGPVDGIRIEVDRGAGTFSFLAYDTIPDYEDTFPLPPLGQTAIWKYRAVYIIKDQAEGQYSDWLEVTVTGL